MSNIWIEDKYINFLSSRLSRFSKKDSYLYNFRCPYCGDSQKNKFKSRGYIFQNKGSLFYRCHNCGISKNASTFIKDNDPQLYKEYRLEVLKESNQNKSHNREKNPEKIETPEKVISEERSNILQNLKKLNHFDETHPINKYINGRNIPDDVSNTLYYSDRFMEWVNTKLPNKFTEQQLKMDEPRLVIPFIDEKGNVFAVTGRSFKKNSIKYITIKFDDEQNKIYGLDKIDKSKRVYVVEGPIDSFFIPNSIAFAGSSGALPKLDDFVIILDNEPRNKDILKLMEKFINRGENVCIWPDHIEEKDINEMIMNGLTQDDIKKLIDENTFSGLKAKMRFNAYKKI